MLESIHYVEIRCSYNKLDLKRFTGALIDNSAGRALCYRNRKYVVAYIEDEDEFRVFNSRGLLVATIVGDSFQFYVTSAPELGIELIFGFMSKLSIYPVKA